MQITPRTIAEQNDDSDWEGEKKGTLYLSNFSRISYNIQKNHSPIHRGAVIAVEDNEDTINQEEKADLFAQEFMETIGEYLTPRLTKALIDKLSDSFIDSHNPVLGKERLKDVIVKNPSF